MSKPYRKIEIWGIRFFVVMETEFEMLVAARMSLIPLGVEARRAGNGWGVVWVELPAGFHRPWPEEGFIFSGQEIGSEAAAGIAPEEDG
jgi:hypothetical protein